jgi:hypothetical protein
MPEIKARISSMLAKYEAELLELGDPVEETQEARVNDSRRSMGRGGGEYRVTGSGISPEPQRFVFL